MTEPVDNTIGGKDPAADNVTLTEGLEFMKSITVSVDSHAHGYLEYLHKLATEFKAYLSNAENYVSGEMLEELKKLESMF